MDNHLPRSGNGSWAWTRTWWLPGLLATVLAACGPIEVPAHVRWDGGIYYVVSVCLSRYDVTDQAVSADGPHGKVPARPIVGILAERGIAVDAKTFSACKRRGWVAAVSGNLSDEQAKAVWDRIQAVQGPGNN